MGYSFNSIHLYAFIFCLLFSFLIRPFVLLMLTSVSNFGFHIFKRYSHHIQGKASLPGFTVLPLRQFGTWGPEISTKLDPQKDTYVMVRTVFSQKMSMSLLDIWRTRHMF